jgi:MFS family permease
MHSLFKRIPFLNPLGTQQVVPDKYRRRFFHLYMDVVWYGLLAGTTLAFLNVYAARMGATAFQIGLLTAGPALVNLVFTLPAGRWLHTRPIGRSVFASAVMFRFLFLVYALLPLLVPPQYQIQAMILATVLFTIPGTGLVVGFNALFATAVPIEWRGYVVGRRNALLSVVYVVASLLSGFILNHTTVEVGYTVVFGLGFVGAAMSAYHLSYLRKIRERPADQPKVIRQIIGDAARPGSVRGGMGVGSPVGVALRSFTRGGDVLRLGVLRGGYGLVIAALFVFHTAQFMPTALFPLRWVDQLQFTDGQIAVGTAVFHSTVLVGSLYFAHITERFGNLRITVAGAAILSLYPLLTAFMPDFGFFVLTSIVGGLGWAFIGGALANYLLERIPANDRPVHLAWYNMALNAAILVGALFGPYLAGRYNLQVALVFSFVFRLLGAVFIWLADRHFKPSTPTTPNPL